MENFNRVLSFIIGFIVIVVIIAIIAGRLNLRERFSNVTSSLRRPVLSGTPTPRISPTVTPIVGGNTRQPTPTTTYYNNTNPGRQPTKIPSTGPTLFIPLALGGLYLGKKLSNFKK